VGEKKQQPSERDCESRERLRISNGKGERKGTNRSRDKGEKKNPPSSRGGLLLILQTLAAPRPPVPAPTPRRRRRRPPRSMAKSRPPKRILESYTIKGSDKLIKREAPLPSHFAPSPDPEFTGVFLGGFFVARHVHGGYG
jgi:hypothetical protein